MITLENAHLHVEISEMGAEMQTLTDRKNGRELLWHGDATWWHGRSPILFPIVGRFWKGVGRDRGRLLEMGAHGFARKMPWQVEAQDATSATFLLQQTEETLAQWPHCFQLRVRYALEEARVNVEFSVFNPSADETLYFQVGGHPAISLPDVFSHPVSGYLVPLGGTPESMLRAGEGGCLEPARVPCPYDAESGSIPFDVRTFVNEALIIDDHQIRGVDVLDGERRPLVRVESTAPVWLFWQPMYMLTPFVCCEPWYGAPDRQGFEGDISERPFIQQAAPGATWQGEYSITVL